MAIEAEPELIAGIDRTLATIAIISAFAAAPMLPFVNPDPLFNGGCWGAIGFGLSFTTRHTRGALRWALSAVAASTLIGMFVEIVPATLEAVRNAESNDRRCIAIQRDMLSARPRRADGPNLFQALGCRPQGEGSVFAAPVVRQGIERAGRE